METLKKKLMVASLVVLLPGLCLFGSNQLSAEKKNAWNTAKAFIGSIQERAKNRLVDSDQLVRMMTANVTGHQDRTKSWDILQQEEKNNDLLSWYTKEVNLLLQGLNQKKPAGLDDFFTPEEKSAFLKCPDEVIKTYLNNNFGKSVDEQTSIFAKARKKACDLQLDSMVKDVYPTEEEVDTALNQNKVSDLGNKILEKLIKRQTGPVFSENIAALGSNFIEPALKDAGEQFQRQGSIVSQSYGGSYVVPEDIASFIQNEIVQYQEVLKKEKQGKTIATKVYNTFPSVKGKVVTKSSEIAIKRFRESVADMILPIDKDTLRKSMEISFSSHSNKNQSWDSCLKSFHDAVANKAINTHTAKASPDKRTAFRQFLSSLIFNSDQSCKDAVNGLVEKSLRDSFDNIRKEISEEQFKEFFQPLESKTWKPSEDEIDSWYNRSLSISQPLKMPGISSKSFDSSALFEETVESVLKAEQSAIGKGLSALREQMSTVQGLEAQMEREVAASPAGPPLLDKVIQSYAEKVKTAWSLSDFSKDYPNFFKRTEKDIDMRSRKVLDAEIKQQKDIQARSQVQDSGRSKTLSLGGGTGKNDGADSKGSGGGGGSGTGGGVGGGGGPGKEKEEPGDEMPDVILDFSYQRGNFYVDIMFPKEEKEKIELRVQGSIKRNLVVLLQATDIFSQWLGKVSQKAEPDQKEINVYVFARVFNEESVLYSLVCYFRKTMVAALQKIGDKRIKIHWSDDLFDEPDDVDTYKGKPVLPPSFKKGNMSTLWT
jgi:hypothetical protein